MSYSRISLFRTCPLWFKRRYVEKRPEPVGSALVIGSAVHDALQLYFDMRLEREKDPETLALAQYYARWQEKPFLGSDNWNGKIIWNRTEEECRELGAELLELAFQRELKPVTAEQAFEREFSGVPFTGRLDLIDGRGYIIDYKTKSGRWSSSYFRKKEFAKDIQPVAYAALLGGPAEVEFEYLLKTKEPKLVFESRKVTQEEIDWFAEFLVPSIAEAIQKEAFWPADWPWSSGWPCKYCSFSEGCKAS